MGLSVWLYLFLIFILQLQFAYYYHPTQAFSYSPPSHNHSLCPYEQTLALLQFKQNFNDSSASAGCDSFSRPKTRSWNRTIDCCKWEGVTCDGLTGHVIGLDLSCSQLQGTIHSNSTLFKLSHLKRLNLAYNDFDRSRISHQFGRFASLTHLNLSDSYFTGLVPSEIQHLSNLVSLDLSNLLSVKLETNNFGMLFKNLTKLSELSLASVDISSSVFPMNLSSSLTLLDLTNTGLHGNLPGEILNLPNLQMVMLSDNMNLTGYLPKASNVSSSSPLRWLDLSSCNFLEGLTWDFFVKLRHLSHLYLSANNLNGLIPSSIDNLTQLEHLDLSFNSLTDPIPSSIGNLTQLEYLDLSTNSLTGPIPSSIGNLTELVVLYLSYNSLTGPIPSSIGNLTELVMLELRNTSLTGPIPSSIGSLTKLESLILKFNSLTSPIPSSIGSLTKLESLILSFNSLTGPIPSSIGSLTQLTNLYLLSNSLTGPIPSSIGSLTQLTDLHLLSNSLTGPIPSSIGNLSQLSLLILSSNSLTGPIPSSIGSLTQLIFLDLSSNSLTGPIPSSIGSLTQLETLYLLSNSLTGPIPSSTGNLSQLSSLDLSSNSLTGVVELSMFSNLRYISALDLSNNNLSVKTTNTDINATFPKLKVLRLSSCKVKEFPDLLRSNNYIKLLDLRHNIIQGPLLSTICNLISIEVLDLSYNNLSGEILPCLGNFSGPLSVLNLKANKFHGTIPTTFAKGNNFVNLNFNGNHLEGKLPRSLANCKQLEVLDLGNNQLNDTFPTWLGTLSELKVFVLKSNRFHGSIPNSAHAKSPFSKLQIIDLSNNDFSGRLPSKYFRYFKAMMKVEGNSTKPEYMSGPSPTRYYTRYYEYSVTVVMKGMEREMEKILVVFTTIDMSNNKFEGEIPNCIGNLRSLRGLILSHNKLVGPIPPLLAKLSVLETLDLSSNQLEGEIPQQLAGLTTLEFLNLSQNHLEGRIPQGKQFNTFGNDSYGENSALCGFPLSKDCEGDKTPHQRSPTNLQQDDDSYFESGFTWKAVCLGYGCGTILGLVMGYLMFLTGKPKRLTRFVEKYQYKNGMKRGRQRRTRRKN